MQHEDSVAVVACRLVMACMGIVEAEVCLILHMHASKEEEECLGGLSLPLKDAEILLNFLQDGLPRARAAQSYLNSRN